MKANKSIFTQRPALKIICSLFVCVIITNCSVKSPVPGHYIASEPNYFESYLIRKKGVEAYGEITRLHLQYDSTYTAVYGCAKQKHFGKWYVKQDSLILLNEGARDSNGTILNDKIYRQACEIVNKKKFRAYYNIPSTDNKSNSLFVDIFELDQVNPIKIEQ